MNKKTIKHWQQCVAPNKQQQKFDRSVTDINMTIRFVFVGGSTQKHLIVGVTIIYKYLQYYFYIICLYF